MKTKIAIFYVDSLRPKLKARIKSKGVAERDILFIDRYNQPLHFEKWVAAFAKITNQSRIYFCAHGAASSERPETQVFSCKDGSAKIFVESVADLIAQYVKLFSQGYQHNSYKPSSSRLKIILISCFSSFTKIIEYKTRHLLNYSHAALFSYYFENKHGISVEVKGFTNPVAMLEKTVVISQYKFYNYQRICAIDRKIQQLSEKNKDLPQSCVDEAVQIKMRLHDLQQQRSMITSLPYPKMKLSDYLYPHHALQSALIYSYEAGCQIVMPAYQPITESDKWRYTLFETIVDCMIKTDCEPKRLGLKRLLNTIATKSNPEIYTILSKELKTCQHSFDTHYHINQHANIFMKLFHRQSRTMRMLSDLYARVPADVIEHL